MAGIVWSKRLAKLLAVAVLVAVTCVALGIWQIARLHQKQQFNAAVRAGLAVAPAPVDAVLTHEYPLADALEAFAVAKDAARSSKVLLRFAD